MTREVAEKAWEELVDVARTVVWLCDGDMPDMQEARKMALMEGSPLVENAREVLKAIGRKPVEPPRAISQLSELK